MPDQDFKSNFNDFQSPEPINGDLGDDVVLYAFPSNARNVCFVLSDGRRVFFNYAYLVSVELNFQIIPNTIKLHFTSQTILISGYKLVSLFNDFIEQKPKVILINTQRYSSTKSNCFIIVEINFCG